MIHSKFFEDLATQGLSVASADLGGNIMTRGTTLFVFSRLTRFGFDACGILRITIPRNPCHQTETFMLDLLCVVLDCGPNNKLLRKVGVIAIVLRSGPVKLEVNIDMLLP